MRNTLGLVMRLRGVKDGDLGQSVGMTTQMIQKRRAGRPPVPISAGEVEVFAKALNVPLYVMYEDEGEVLRWFSENGLGPFTQGSRQFAWDTADDYQLAHVA